MRNYGLFPIRAQRSSPDERDAGRQPNRALPVPRAGRPAPSLAERLRAARQHRLWTMPLSCATFFIGCFYLGYGGWLTVAGYGLLLITLGLFLWCCTAIWLVARLEEEWDAAKKRRAAKAVEGQEKYLALRNETLAAVERALELAV